MKRIYLIVLLILFVTTSAYSQRRYVDKPKGFSFGIGGSYAQGDNQITAQGIHLTSSFTHETEFSIGYGQTSQDHESMDYISAGVNVFTHKKISSMFSVDYMRYIKEKINGVSFIGGLSIMPVRSKTSFIGAEFGLGASVLFSKQGHSELEKSFLIGIFAGLQTSDNFLIMLGPSASFYDGKFIGSLSVGTLFF